jgi:hypothetical protein
MFHQWKSANGITDDLDDGDGDHIPAVVEFVLDADLGASSHADLPTVGYDPGSGLVQVQVRRLLNTGGVRTILEWSTDLSGWSPVPAANLLGGTVSPDLKTITESWRIDPPAGTSGTVYVRLLVTS